MLTYRPKYNLAATPVTDRLADSQTERQKISKRSFAPQTTSTFYTGMAALWRESNDDQDPEFEYENQLVIRDSSIRGGGQACGSGSRLANPDLGLRIRIKDCGSGSRLVDPDPGFRIRIQACGSGSRLAYPHLYNVDPESYPQHWRGGGLFRGERWNI